MAARIESLTAPVGGWNARDSLAEMPPGDAVFLTNFLPTPTECRLRYGYSQFSTGLPAQVETIFAYAGAGTDKIFGVSNGSIYDCTAGGAVGAAAVAGMANSRFQYVNMATAGGNFLLAVNGANKMRYFDGTTWTADGGTFTVTVADTSNWTNMTIHKQRVWGIQSASLVGWYLPPSSISGAASKFDMSAFFKLGGTLVGIETWTLDGGEGLDDYLVFMSSKGEALIYRGTDPSSVATWQMVGLYRIGSPVGTRCLYKYMGDVLVICQDGIVPLSTAIQSERVQHSIAVSNKIMYAVSDAVSNYGSTFGWQLLNFPKENQLILNVPVSVGSQQQYVMNTINQSWCNYTGWAANCWELYKDSPYFGGNTFIGKAWDTNADNGSNINAIALQAFNRFETDAQKRLTMSRPIFRATQTPSVLAAINVDYDQNDNTVALAFTPAASGSVWDTGTWDNATWGSGNLLIFKNWQGAAGVGVAIAPMVKTASRGFDLRWDSTDLIFEVAKGTFI